MSGSTMRAAFSAASGWRWLTEAHRPIIGLALSMSSGTSITTERTFLSANASWPVQLKPWNEPSAQRERGLGQRVAVPVDVDPVDPVGVEIRSHQERRHRAHAGR